MKQVVYTCKICNNRRIRKHGHFYTADVPTCHDQIMQSKEEEYMTIDESKEIIKNQGVYIVESDVMILDNEECIWFSYAQFDKTAISFPILVNKGKYLELTAIAVFNFLSNYN